jgi:hypothetical protein
MGGDTLLEQAVTDVISSPEYCPCLFIGKYVTEFKKQYKDKIFMASTLEAVRNIVDNYTGVSSLEGRYIVLDGVGFLSDVGQNSLLKFIEESMFPIVLLSYYDKVSPIILSRMKFIYKSPVTKVSNLFFDKLSECFETVEEKSKEARGHGEEFSDLERTKYFAEHCPMAYYFERRVPRVDYTSKRINRIISKI